VARWGMAEELGPIDLRQSEDHPFLGQSIAQPRSHSDATTAVVDKSVMKLLKDAEESATGILSRHRARVENLIATLEQHETLDFERIRQCLDPDSTVTPLKRPDGQPRKAPPTD